MMYPLVELVRSAFSLTKEKGRKRHDRAGHTKVGRRGSFPLFRYILKLSQDHPAHKTRRRRFNHCPGCKVR